MVVLVKGVVVLVKGVVVLVAHGSFKWAKTADGDVYEGDFTNVKLHGRWWFCQ